MANPSIGTILNDPLYDKNYENVTLFGVLTYISEPKAIKNGKSTVSTITLVDNTCKFTERLKCNVFVDAGISKPFQAICKIGDIIRVHRLKVIKIFITCIFILAVLKRLFFSFLNLRYRILRVAHKAALQYGHLG
jgi:hypothetical protein